MGVPMSYDPDERFSIYPTTGEEALRKLLGAEESDEAEEVEEPSEEAEADS